MSRSKNRRKRPSPATFRTARPAPARTAGPGDDPAERRSHPRHVSLEFRAWLAWRTDDGRLSAEGVRLLDISRTGACCEAAGQIPRDRPVLLALHGLKPDTAGVWARVLAVGKTPRGDSRIHMEFDATCPEPLFRSALEGIRNASPHHRIRPVV